MYDVWYDVILYDVCIGKGHTCLHRHATINPKKNTQSKEESIFTCLPYRLFEIIYHNTDRLMGDVSKKLSSFLPYAPIENRRDYSKDVSFESSSIE